jgi:hypothetical protein
VLFRLNIDHFVFTMGLCPIWVSPTGKAAADDHCHISDFRFPFRHRIFGPDDDLHREKLDRAVASHEEQIIIDFFNVIAQYLDTIGVYGFSEFVIGIGSLHTGVRKLVIVIPIDEKFSIGALQPAKHTI